MKALLDLFKQVQKDDNFEAIRSASRRQKKSAHGLSVKSKNQKRLTTARSNLNAMVCFAPKFLARLKTTNACAANTNASNTVV